MPNITLRNDGRYMIRKMVNGISKCYYTRNYQKAQKIYKDLEKNKIIEDKQKEKTKYTIEKWLEEWCKLYKEQQVKNSTLCEIKRIIKIINKKFGKYDIKEIDTKSIQKFLNSIEKGRPKERLTTYFNSALQKAEDLDIISKNPFKAVIRDKKIKNKNVCFKYEEQEKIISIFKNTEIEHEIFVYLMCGCRPNELPNKEQFDFKNNLINIYGTKTDKALHRQIEMSKEFSNYMKEYFNNNEIKPLPTIKRIFKEKCESINIDKPILYRLRHTFATNHFTLNTPAKQVQEWLGHTTINMTLDIYTDIDKTATKDKIVKLYNNFYYIK